MAADRWTQIWSLVEWWLTGRENKVLCGKPVPVSFCVQSSWNVMAHGDVWEGKWRGNWRMEWVASTLHTTSERGVSSISNADAHNSAASSRLNWHTHQFKWTRPFCRKKKSGFCACAITFQTQSTTTLQLAEDLFRDLWQLCKSFHSPLLEVTLHLTC